jgi:hypothetical protein
MSAWSGPFLIACVLLAAAGMAKALDPITTVGALRGVGLRVPGTAVRIGGGIEAVVAVAAALTGAPLLAALVGLSYLAFTGFVVVALTRRVPIGSCGCFGKVDTPPSALHVVLDLGAVVAAVGAMTAGGSAGLIDGYGGLPLAGLPFLLLVALGAYAAFAAMTVVPRLVALRTHP